jgi:hypothetical protein
LKSNLEFISPAAPCRAILGGFFMEKPHEETRQAQCHHAAII